MVSVKDYGSFTVKIPFSYPSLNELLKMHWRERSKRKENFLMAMAFTLNQADAPTFDCPVRVSITLHFKLVRRRDPDNYSPKFLLDSLVKCKVIPDDNKDIIETLNVNIIDGEAEDSITLTVERAR